LTQYSLAVVDEILAELAAGKALIQICKRADMPCQSLFYEWLSEDRDGLVERYARARQAQAHVYAEKVVECANDRSRDTYIDANGDVLPNSVGVARSRLQADAYKWAAGKLAPKVYGDKLELAGDKAAPLTFVLANDETNL
jgi:hypothetical protein